MKRLYLIRHAKSSWKDASLQDIDRPLNARGKRDAPYMGQCLVSYHVRPDALVSSPAKRALKTAHIIAREIGFPTGRIKTDEAIYEAGVSTLLKVIHSFDNAAGQIMLFGHNPGFNNLAERLTGTFAEHIPTCGIVCIDFEVDSWKDIEPETGKLIFFDYPKKHQ